MHDLLTPVRSPDRNRRPALDAQVLHDARISVIDRLSLRVGLWLLLRATRRLHPRRDHTDHARLLAEHRAREERALRAERQRLLCAPRL